MSLLALATAGVTAFKLGKKIWSAVKKPKPKIKVSDIANYSAPSQQVAGIQQASLPAIPAAKVQLPALAAGGATSVGIPWWTGPGGKLQAPWSDPKMASTGMDQYGRPLVLDDAYLKPYYRAPKGYVVVRDPNGRPYAMNKWYARKIGMWKPAAKPPISATDWKHYKRNKAIEKKLKKIVPPSLRTKRIVAKKKGR